MPYKQVILVRMDLKLPKGKLAVQCAHAAVDCVLKTERKVLEHWLREGGKKVVLEVASRADLLRYRERADDLRLKSALIVDAGKTTVEPGTMTCLGIGPDEEAKIDALTGMLKIV